MLLSNTNKIVNIKKNDNKYFYIKDLIIISVLIIKWTDILLNKLTI